MGEREIIGPKNKTEEELLEIFKYHLKIDKISVTDSFFELGGDSLLAITLSLNIYEKTRVRISVKDLFENPTIIKLASLISNSKNVNTNLEKIPKTVAKEYYHLSSAQKRIYFTSKMAKKDNTLYNMPGAIVFDKKPNMQKLNKCFEKLIEKHSSLRTYFDEIDNEVYQKVLPSLFFKIDEMKAKTDNIDEIIQEFVKPFDLNKAPLFRACFTSMSDKFLLLFDMHHIICDGVSLNNFIKELSELYNMDNLLQIEEDLDKKITYIDYSEWEFDKLQNASFKESKDFWINEFKGNILALDLQTDFTRPNLQAFEGSKVYENLDLNLAEEIYSLAKKLDVSAYMLLLCVYYVLLYKYSMQEDIVVGTPAAARNKEELLDMLGMFVNTLPLKNHIEPNISFEEFLDNVKVKCLKAFEYQDYPFDELVNSLNLPRDTSRSPLFDTMFIYQNNGISSTDFKDIKTSIYIPDTKISKFDLSLEVVPRT